MTAARSVGRTLDFGDPAETHSAGIRARTDHVGPHTPSRAVSRGRALPSAGLLTRAAEACFHVLPWRGRDKYRLLEHRRRQAQIKARRLLAAAE
jgi:hypothetical protein